MKKPSMTVGTKAHRTAVTMKKESMAKLKKSMAKKEDDTENVPIRTQDELDVFYKGEANKLKNILASGSEKGKATVREMMKKYNLKEIPEKFNLAAARKKYKADQAYNKRKANLKKRNPGLSDADIDKVIKTNPTKMVMPKDKPPKKVDEKSPKRPPKPKKPAPDFFSKESIENFPRKLTKFDKLKMEKNKAKKMEGKKAKPAQKVVEKKPGAPKMKKPAVKLKHKSK